MKEHKLKSGAVLKITPSPFADAKALYQAMLKEMKEVPLSSKTEISELYKNFFCIGFSSEAIEQKLYKCFERCTYNSGNGDLRIDDKTFEPIKAREDYMEVCVEVAKENVFPFGKSLYAEYEKLLKMSDSSPK